MGRLRIKVGRPIQLLIILIKVFCTLRPNDLLLGQSFNPSPPFLWQATAQSYPSLIGAHGQSVICSRASNMFRYAMLVFPMKCSAGALEDRSDRVVPALPRKLCICSAATNYINCRLSALVPYQYVKKPSTDGPNLYSSTLLGTYLPELQNKNLRPGGKS